MVRADEVCRAGLWLPAPPPAAPAPTATPWQSPAAEAVDLSGVGRVRDAVAPHGRPLPPCGGVAIAEPATGQWPLPSWSCTIKSWHDSPLCGREYSAIITHMF